MSKKPAKETQSGKVLSIRQPYVDEILFGDKWCENRTWDTKYRGTLYIHASRWDCPKHPTDGEGTTGAIIGHVTLLDVLPLQVLKKLRTRKTKPDEHAEVWEFLQSQANSSWQHVCGDFCWIFINPVTIEPLKMPGKLNLWNAEI